MNALPETFEWLAVTPGARGVVRSDGAGALVSFGGDLVDAEAWAERIDLAFGAMSALGADRGAGDAIVIIVELEGALVIGTRAGTGHLSAVATREANIGLVLSLVRRSVEASHGAEG